MGLYYQTCQKSVYKGNFKPSYVACPYTWSYVELTDQVRKKISKEKKPKLSDKEPIYTVDKKMAMEKGLKTVLKLEDGNELGVY